MPPISHELQIHSTSPPREALPNNITKNSNERQRTPDTMDFNNMIRRVNPQRALQIGYNLEGKQREGDMKSNRPSVVQSIIDTAAQVERIPNPYPLPVIGMESLMDPRFRPADHSLVDNLAINAENFDAERSLRTQTSFNLVIITCYRNQ